MPNRDLINSSDTSRFFDFRSLAGMPRNNVTDVPYKFYVLAPTRLKPLYIELLRVRQWAGGYVPGVHSQLLSSNVVPKLTNIMTNKVINAGYKYDGDDHCEDKMKIWDRQVGMKHAMTELVYNVIQSGYAFTKINIEDGIPVPEVVMADQASFTTKNGEIVEFNSSTVFVDGNNEEEAIYKIERRYYDKDGLPTVEHGFYQSVSQFDQGSERLFNNDLKGRKIEPTNEFLAQRLGVPRGQWTAYRRSMKPKALPMRNLGVYKFKSTVKNPKYIKFDIGQSLVSLVGEDNLIRYEIAQSLEGHEGIIAPQLILVPPEMENGKTQIFMDGQLMPTSVNSTMGSKKQLNGTYYVNIPYQTADGEKVEPKAVEFNIRSGDIKGLKNSILEDACANLGFDANDIIPSVSGVYKSKDRDKKSITLETIEAKRQLISTEMNKMLKDIMWMYGVDNPNVSLIWSGSQIEEFKTKVDTYSVAVRNFFMSQETAIRRLFPDMTERELQEEIERIDKYRHKIIETFYGGGKDGEKTSPTDMLTGENSHNDEIARKAEGD